MQTNRKLNLTMTSKLMVLISKFFQPDVTQLKLPKGHYVDNDEMYSLQQDRVDANPQAFHPDSLEHRENTKRNLLINGTRRYMWNKACKVGMVTCFLGIAFWSAVNYGTDQIIKGVNHVEKSIDDSNRSAEIKAESKQMTLDTIMHQVAQLKSDCESGKKEVAACQAEMNVLKQQYEDAKK